MSNGHHPFLFFFSFLFFLIEFRIKRLEGVHLPLKKKKPSIFYSFFKTFANKSKNVTITRRKINFHVSAVVCKWFSPAQWKRFSTKSSNCFQHMARQLIGDGDNCQDATKTTQRGNLITVAIFFCQHFLVNSEVYDKILVAVHSFQTRHFSKKMGFCLTLLHKERRQSWTMSTFIPISIGMLKLQMILTANTWSNEKSTFHWMGRKSK